MRLDDPEFRYPSGKTRAEMDDWHRQWELAHQEAENGDRPVRPPSIPSTGEADPALDDDAAYAARMASRRPIRACPVCGDLLADLT